MSVTSTDMKASLLKHYAPPSHRVFFEVSNDTGVKARRWIDAIALGIWPSTGHEIVGIEIKVSRGDWKRELAAPDKAQTLMRFCTRWYLAAPEGLVKPDELPATWGLIERKADGAMRQKVCAKLLEPEPLTAGFLMAVLRNASGVDMELVSKLVAERDAERHKRFEREIDQAAERRVRDVGLKQERALKVAEKIEALTGEKIENWLLDEEALAAAYKLVKATGIHRAHGYGMDDLPGIVQGLERAQHALKAIYDMPELAVLRAKEPA